MKRLDTLLSILLMLVVFGCKPEDKGPDDYVIPTMDLKITSFGFSAENNKILGGKDAIAVIKDDEIFVDCPGVTSLVNLIPSFEGTFSKVFLNGGLISSGKTTADFSGDCSLVLKGHTDKQSRTYKVYVRSGNLIPKVSIRTPNDITSRTEYQTATIKITNCPQFGSIDAPGKARGRGNATFLSYPKKSYRFKLDEGEKVCGYHKNRDWVLLAEYCDKSLMRTTYMNALSKAAGCEWTPEGTHVDLYLNGNYNGTYLLIEQVEKANHKIEMEDDGFIIEDDNYYSWEPFHFTTTLYGRHYTFKYPSAGDGDIKYHDENYYYMKNFMNTMESTLNGAGFKDPENGYRKYMDVPSFVRWYLVMELLSCQDPNYFYVLPTKGAKLKMYPAWDAEWTLGNAYAGPGGWTSLPPEFEKKPLNITRRYFPQQFKDPYFVEQVYLAWQDMKGNLNAVKEEVAAEVENVRLSQKENFKRWDILSRQVSVEQIVLGSWEAEVDYAAKWFDKRIAWFDTYIKDLYDKSR
ncbi:MAG: CotH kinase family protein [Bacteroidales bacterium]|nr:CotH kinase family protein [Candidatus Cryptobacteroides faecihippi]